MRKILLKHDLCPGDVLVLTAAVECLAQQYPGEFRIGVSTNHNDIFKYNPHITVFKKDEPGVEVINCKYDLIHKCDALPVHFMGAFVEDLAEKLKVKLRLRLEPFNRPALYLSSEEKQRPEGFPQPYALICAGVKKDYTCKGAGTQIYQEIVDAYRGTLDFVQVGMTKDRHKPLTGVVNMIGQTNNRELIRLAYHSVLGVGGVTFLHHIYAAFQRPYVCFLGGREPLSWIQYPTAVMLNTLGQLPCCRAKACWQNRVIPLNDGDEKDKRLCRLPVVQPDGETVPACMQLLGSEAAIKAIDNMIAYGVIPIKV